MPAIDSRLLGVVLVFVFACMCWSDRKPKSDRVHMSWRGGLSDVGKASGFDDLVASMVFACIFLGKAKRKLGCFQNAKTHGR